MSNRADDPTPHIPTLAEQLTARFYAWEERGRGWQVWDHPVDLEPAYKSFFHCLPELSVPIDDGRKPAISQLLAEKLHRYFPSIFKTEQSPPPADSGEPIVEPAAFEDESEICEISISSFPQEKIIVEATEQFLLGLAGCSFPVSFEIVAQDNHIGTQMACRSQDVGLVHQQLEACFPDAVLLEDKERLAASWQHEKPTVVVDFGLSYEFMRPLKVFRKLDPDPLVGLIGAMEGIGHDELGLLQVLFQRVQHPWADDVLRSVTDWEGHSFFTDSPEMLSLAKEKSAKTALCRGPAHRQPGAFQKPSVGNRQGIGCRTQTNGQSTRQRTDSAGQQRL